MVITGRERVGQFVLVLVTNSRCFVIIGDALFHVPKACRLPIKKKQLDAWHELSFIVERIIRVIILAHQYLIYMVIHAVTATQAGTGIESTFLST